MRFNLHSMAIPATIAIVLLFLHFSVGEQSQLQRSKTRRKMTVNTRSTLECHRREYTFKAVNRDESTGKQCSDFLTVESCWGRCNSGEISDYYFPFKKSFHYVCMHLDMKKVSFQLKNCEPGAPSYLRHYEVAVAQTCGCRLCETSQTNCESFPTVYS